MTNRHVFFVAVLLLLLVLMLSRFLSIESLSAKGEVDGVSKKENLNRPDYPPIKIIREYSNGFDGSLHAEIVLEKQHFSRKNLEKLFLWYANSHKSKTLPLSIDVATDPGKFNDGKFVDFINEKEEQEYRKLNPGPDAHCDRLFDSSSFADNLFFRFRPDPDRHFEFQTVVLRGKYVHAAEDELQVMKAFRKTTQDCQLRGLAYRMIDRSIFPKEYYLSIQIFDSEAETWDSLITIQSPSYTKFRNTQIRSVKDQIAYAYLGWMYVVTLDGGKSWSKWDAEADLQNWNCCDPELIQNVQVFSDGKGIMRLRNISDSSKKLPLELHTSDFGQHWSYR